MAGVFRSSRPEVFLGKGVLKICSKFTGEHPCRSVNSIKFQSNFIEIALRYGCSPVNLLQIFRTPFPRNITGWLLLHLIRYHSKKLLSKRGPRIKFCETVRNVSHSLKLLLTLNLCLRFFR